MVVAPHKKSRQIRSNKQGLAAIAKGISDSIAAQNERFKKQMRAEEEKEKRLLEFRAAEAEKDRQHEMRMAQLFMTLKQPVHSTEPEQQFFIGGFDYTGTSGYMEQLGFVSPTREQP